MSVDALQQLTHLTGVRTASELASGIAPHPVDAPLRPVYSRGGLPRGEILQVTGDHAVSLALASVAALTHEDRWVCTVGLGALSSASIADFGVDLDRFVSVATPDREWLRVTSVLVESFDVLLVRPRYRTTPTERSRLAAKVRERRAALVSLDPFAGSTEQLSTTALGWDGAQAGHGRLSGCRVAVHGSRTGSHTLLLPGPSGRVESLTRSRGALSTAPPQPDRPLPGPRSRGALTIAPPRPSPAADVIPFPHLGADLPVDGPAEEGTADARGEGTSGAEGPTGGTAHEAPVATITALTGAAPTATASGAAVPTEETAAGVRP